MSVEISAEVHDVPCISIIICSRNRAKSLARCLAYISASEMKECGGELILVDNGSSDDTWEMIRSFQAASNFPVHIEEVKCPGLSRARNAGLRRASGDLIVFTDDDCYFTPGFLRNALAVFSKNNIDYCGGRILLFDPQDSPYGCNLRTEFKLIPPCSFVQAGEIQGANMVVRRRVVDKVGAFDETMGAGSGTLFRCEDVDYCGRASWSGFVGAHVPDLAVYHHHGRKAGEDITKLSHENDIARGAYFAKFILAGRHKYLVEWVRSWRWQAAARTLRELKGAAAYTLFALNRLLRNPITANAPSL